MTKLMVFGCKDTLDYLFFVEFNEQDEDNK
jgi:hypothetical protein